MVAFTNPAPPPTAVTPAARPAVDGACPTHDPLAAELPAAHGRLAVCRLGKIAVVLGRAFVEYPDGSAGWAFVGQTAAGTPWSSRAPIWLAPDEVRRLTPLFPAALHAEIRQP